MEVKFIYSKIQLEDAVKFISEHNEHVLGQVDRIKNSILTSMRELAKNFPVCYWISTMGYTVIADITSKESMDKDENIVSFEVLVNPSINNNIYVSDTQSEIIIFQKEEMEIIL